MRVMGDILVYLKMFDKYLGRQPLVGTGLSLACRAPHRYADMTTWCFSTAVQNTNTNANIDTNTKTNVNTNENTNSNTQICRHDHLLLLQSALLSKNNVVVFRNTSTDLHTWCFSN